MTRVEKIQALPLSLAIIAGLGKTFPRSRASTLTRKGTTQVTTPSPEKTYQKTSIHLGDVHFND